MELHPETSASGARPTPKLSICISTLNRADFIRATLDSIVPQLTDQCEIVVLDNASVDGTELVVGEVARRTERLRYLKKSNDKGLDGNFDRAVEQSRGEYCWLMPDDDFVKPGAVAAVLDVLNQEQPSLVLVNYEFRDFSMTKVLQDRVLDFEADRVYGAWELERMFGELQDFIRYIGAVVIKRDVWLARQRELYNGSHYAFVGMIYQERFPGPVHVIAKPCVSFRAGNQHAYTPKIMEIVLAKWPSLVASLPLADAAKRKVHSAEPWKHVCELLFWRGRGFYSLSDYRRWIRPQLRLFRHRIVPVIAAVLPAALANAVVSLRLFARRKNFRQMEGLQFGLLRMSPFYLWNWRIRGGEKHQRRDSALSSS